MLKTPQKVIALTSIGLTAVVVLRWTLSETEPHPFETASMTQMEISVPPDAQADRQGTHDLPRTLVVHRIVAISIGDVVGRIQSVGWAASVGHLLGPRQTGRQPDGLSPPSLRRNAQPDD